MSQIENNGRRIPTPPEAFIEHPYLLLRTQRLIGRRIELENITDWAAKPGTYISDKRILNIVSTGGIGKSALAWEWFNDIAPQKMKSLKGRVWWSFYEIDGTYENFITRVLSYITQRSSGELQNIPQQEREAQLLNALDREPYLIVVDGMEQMLTDHTRSGKARQLYDNAMLGTDSANVALGAPDQAADAGQSQQLPVYSRSGNFLRKLAKLRKSRILAVTRLSMSDLRTPAIEPWPECNFLFLSGLTNTDSFELFNALGANGESESLLRLFNDLDNHPLLIQLIASCSARYQRAPGNFNLWRRDHPDFDPFGESLSEVKSQVIKLALNGLDEKKRRILGIVAAFPGPIQIDMLDEIQADPSFGINKNCALCKNRNELNVVMTELLHRGLVGQDKLADSYDIHPIVRAAVRSGFSGETLKIMYKTLYTKSPEIIDNWRKVDWYTDPEPTIELANLLNTAPDEYKRNVTFIWPR